LGQVQIRAVAWIDVSGSAPLRQRVQTRLDERDDYPRWVLWAALVGMFATSFPVTILTVALGPIADDFDTSVNTMAWVISAPMIGSAVALPVLGKLGDLYGHRCVFLWGFGVATVVTAATAVAWDPLSLIGLRTGATVIGAATMPTAMALIMGVTPAAERVKALGWWALVAAGAPAVGLVAGGPMVDAWGWRPVFVIQSAVAGFAVFFAYLVLRETPRRTDVGFDVRGALSVAVGAGAIMFALNQAPEAGLTPGVVTAGAIGVAGFALFVVAERRATYPLLPLSFFRRRNFTGGLVGSAFAGAAYMGAFAVAPLMLQDIFGYALWAVSLLLLARTAVFSAASPVAGHLGSRIGERPVGIVGTALVAVAMLVLGLGTLTDSIAVVLVGLALQGMGNGGTEPIMSASVANSVDEKDLGVAAASQRMAWQLGAGLGITVMVATYGGTGDPADMNAAFVIGALLAAVAVVAAVFLRSTPRKGDLAGSPTEVDALDVLTPSAESGVFAG
jgi:MFS family permease